MAGVKTVELLVGVILVWQCVGDVQAEISVDNGKKHLKHENQMLSEFRSAA